MSKVGAVFLGIISLFLLIGPFRTPFIDGIHGWRTADTTQSASVNPSGTAANVTLSHDLYQAALAEVSSITTNTTGAPATSAYTEATKVLLIDGLDPGQQTLTIQYYAETDDDVMRLIGPFLMFFLFFGVAGLIVWGVFGKQRR